MADGGQVLVETTLLQGRLLSLARKKSPPQRRGLPADHYGRTDLSHSGVDRHSPDFQPNQPRMATSTQSQPAGDLKKHSNWHGSPQALTKLPDSSSATVKRLDKVAFVLGEAPTVLVEYVCFVPPRSSPSCSSAPHSLSAASTASTTSCPTSTTPRTSSRPDAVRISLTGRASPLFEVCFVPTNGRACGRSRIEKNGLVFHDLTKQTSVSINRLPAMVVYCIRWCLSRRRACGPTGLCLVDRLPVGVLHVLAGGGSDHHTGPAAERPLR